MTEAQMKARIAELEAREKQLLAATQSSIRVERRLDKEGRTWIGVKGIPGTGWGISAEPRGWTVFLDNMDNIRTQVKALL